MAKLRQLFMDDNLYGYEKASSVYQMLLSRFGKDIKSGLMDKSKTGYTTSNGTKHTVLEVEQDITGYAIAHSMAKASKTILFPSEQIEVFISILGKKFDMPFDYRLPFPNTLIEFTSPVEITGFYGTHKIAGFLLEQRESDEKQHKDAVESITSADREFGFSDTYTLDLDYSVNSVITINAAIIIHDDLSGERLAWTSQRPDGLETCEDWSELEESHMKRLKNLAIACVGYINCENVYLHKEGEVAEAINAKRERKGKSRLEPYYICRIRGVNYDSPEATCEGAKHSIRYDVRGHFRRLTNGKTTWVRPHQRGLENELYVPKTYLVDRKDMPQ